METKSTRNFAELVADKREELILTQKEVALQFGVSVRTVQNWESGATPRHEHRRAILEWVNGTVAA